jgi:GNAT superfamily N-acetyltransferase
LKNLTVERGQEMKPEWRIRHIIEPGDIGYLTYLHGTYYSKEYGYDRTFEAYVADGLADFVRCFGSDENRIWLAEVDGRIVGSIATVGHSEEDAQLRWRGLGLGKHLMELALEFCRDQKYGRVFLWTTSELKESARLYERFGFRKVEERTHEIWGKRITEERYDLHL